MFSHIGSLRGGNSSGLVIPGFKFGIDEVAQPETIKNFYYKYKISHNSDITIKVTGADGVQRNQHPVQRLVRIFYIGFPVQYRHHWAKQ